jgi:hypothetical protein
MLIYKKVIGIGCTVRCGDVVSSIRESIDNERTYVVIELHAFVGAHASC